MPGKQPPGFIKRRLPRAVQALLEGKLPPDELWRLSLSGEDPKMHRFRHAFGLFPSSPRCRICNAPFSGPFVPAFRIFNFTRSSTNPKFCKQCLETNPVGGAEVELTMLFADVRGSTALAEQMTTHEFSQLMNRFYITASRILIETDALTGRLVGDEVLGLYVPGFAGPEHAKKGLQAAQELLRVVGYDTPGGAWLPVGVGVHTGIAFVGRVGEQESTTDVTALGDPVNLTARLASQAGAGEILVTAAALDAAHIDPRDLDERILKVKGKSEPIPVRVMRA